MYFNRKLGGERYRHIYRKKDTTLYRRMFVEVSINEEEHEWIKNWADGEQIKMPRAYAELIRCAMKDLGYK